MPVFSAIYSKRVRGYETAGYQIPDDIESPMEHLVRNELKLDQHFRVRVHSNPIDLLNYLGTISDAV